MTERTITRGEALRWIEDAAAHGALVLAGRDARVPRSLLLAADGWLVFDGERLRVIGRDLPERSAKVEPSREELIAEVAELRARLGEAR